MVPGSTVAWTIPATDSNSHSVTDASGMGLFDSGLRAPGSSYTYTFDGAGTYVVMDDATSFTASVSVPDQAEPPSGMIGTTFTITWAAAAPLQGYAFDVQIRRPGTQGYADWRTDQLAASAPFVADAGPGTYSFRARLENLSNGKSAKYSPAATITVTLR